MIRLRLKLLPPLLVVAIAGCGDSATVSSGPMTTTASDAAATDGVPATTIKAWVGTWKSNFGPIRLANPSGTKIVGSYTPCAGTITAVVTPTTIGGVWTEKHVGSNCTRSANAPTKGTFSWTLATDKKSFTGTWRYDDGSTDPKHPTWEGTKSG